MTLNDSNGNFIRTVQVVDSADGPFHDITSIDANTIAVSIGSYISMANIDTQNMLRKIKNKNHCYGITHCDSKFITVTGRKEFDSST